MAYSRKHQMLKPRRFGSLNYVDTLLCLFLECVEVVGHAIGTIAAFEREYQSCPSYTREEIKYPQMHDAASLDHRNSLVLW
jgi:hypothetical protein